MWPNLIELMASYIDKNVELLSPCDPIVISFPGSISIDRSPLAAPIVTESNKRPPNIKALLSRKVGRSVVLMNDLSAAAWSLNVKTNVSRFLNVFLSVSIMFGWACVDRLLEWEVLR